MTINDLTNVIIEKLSQRLFYGTAYLRQVEEPRELAIAIVEAVQIGQTTKQTLMQTCAQVGHHFRRKLRLPLDGNAAFRGGHALLHVLGELGYVDLIAKKKGKHSTYLIKITNWKVMSQLWAEIEPGESAYIQPETTLPDPWVTSYHPKADKMIKKAKDKLLKTITLESHPMLFEVLNNKQSTGYKVNIRILDVYSKLFEVDAEVFEHMNPLLSQEQREGMRMEAKAVLDTATKLADSEFWHLYSFDFRGRIYPLTGYFHEQSSDNAKGLLELSKKVPLGTHGYQWLLIHASNSWGEDKLTLQGRIDYALDNLQEWFEWAMDPVGNLGWTKADKPWSFLSTIMEILAAELHGDLLTFESGLIVYIDGTTNGSQHLTALARDASIAHHVNLVPTEKPGDLYTLIAEATYKDIGIIYNPDLDAAYEHIRNDLIKLYKPLEKLSNNEMINAQWAKIKAYKDDNKQLLKQVAPQFWSQAIVAEKKRKIAKRNVMTLGYGSETKGFSDQLKEDCPKMLDELKFIESTWTWFMADLNFKNCINELRGPAEMLSLFKQLAVLSNHNDEQFAWEVPVTRFPAVQTYFEPETKCIDATWLKTRIQPRINLPEKCKMDKRKQKQAASPNIIHSFDAAHLTMTCLICDFETVTVHDSFGTAAGNMEYMFHIVREEWVKFYETDPLLNLLHQHSAEDMLPAIGSLDHRSILDSEFAFS